MSVLEATEVIIGGRNSAVQVGTNLVAAGEAHNHVKLQQQTPISPVSCIIFSQNIQVFA